ncbi:MAG TPA: cytochrome P450 [Gammaproteobacteria bacterium]
MNPIPKDPLPDSTLALRRDPYRFISTRCLHFGTDLFEARLMLERTLCLRGREAAALFYSRQRFQRGGVMPGWLEKTLFGRGGVQGLDEAAHRDRKQLFLSLTVPARVDLLVAHFTDWLNVYAEAWTARERVVLYPEWQEILTRAVCAWAGVPLPDVEVQQRARQLTAMFDQAAAFGLGHLGSRRARRRAEQWIGRLIDGVRAGSVEVTQLSPLQRIAHFRDNSGYLLDTATATVEVINLLRPTVAVSVYLTFAALALHMHRDGRLRIAAREPGYVERFAQEVRRFYPFFPLVMAQVREDFVWNGYPFPAGRKVALDLYGTNHDDRAWKRPDEFNPDRFEDWDGDLFNFIPQGGGDAAVTHRCPGESITLALMQAALEFLATRLAYDVPGQDLRIDYARLPALPRSRFVIHRVRL